MLSVIMSSSNNDSKPLFESDVKVDAVQEPQPEVFVSGDEKVSSNVNSSSIDSDERGISRVSMHIDENARVPDGDGSLVVDFRGSEEGRVSEGVVEVNEFRVCEIKNETVNEKLKDASDNEAGSGKRPFDLEPRQDVKVLSPTGELNVRSDAGNVSISRKDHYGKENGSEYDSMLSMFDQYAANGKSDAVGYGYDIGDMVWGKVKSHPWWPGHIFNEAFASSSVRRTKREGHVLVAFFGDSSYGWFDPAELIPFEPNFSEKSRQTNSRTFIKAVEEGLEEVNRRQALGLVCKCRNQFTFRHTDAGGYLAVDVGDYEPGFYSISQIKKARESFHPRAMLQFVKQLAVAPMSDEFGVIDLMKNKATVSAFRKQVFEEFDETYAQAFGAQPVRPVVQSAPIEPSRVPLSGRQVFAETLGKGKSSVKPNKIKDHSEKDKYLFKRRDEPNGSKTQKIVRGQTLTTSQHLQRVDSVIPLKGSPPPAVVDLTSHTSVPRVAEALEPSASQSAAPAELGGQEPVQDSVSGNFVPVVTEAKVASESSKLKNGGKKKVKLDKRPAGELNLGSSVPVEKVKKRKKQMGIERRSDHMLTPEVAGKVGTLAGKVGGKPPGDVPSPSVPEDNSIASKVGSSSSGLVDEKPVDVPVVALGDNSDGMKHLGDDDRGKPAILPDDGVNITIPDKNTQLELPELLNDLRALALNPFLGSDSRYPANLVQVFVRFRSVVYMKSLSSLSSGENESKEVRGMFASAADNPPDKMREVSYSAKSTKPAVRVEDPTKGGRKRGPSDRQEEMTLKKKKKMNDLKLLATEKKAGQRGPEVRRGDGKEMGARTMAQIPPEKNGREMARKTMPTVASKLSRFESDKKRREAPVRATDPTMLIMKFPAEAALPSPAELKVKFARFGPLDHSGTRIFWKSSTIRLVYLYRNDAQAALKFATSSTNLFGNSNVRCHLRDLGLETTPETAESSKVVETNTGISQSKDPLPVLQQRLGASSNNNVVASQRGQQLKSCLKKPPGEEGTSTTGGGASGRGRVKFMLGDEGSVRTSSTTSDEGASSSHGHGIGLNYNSEKIHMVIPPIIPPPPPAVPASQQQQQQQQLPMPNSNYHHHHHTELVASRIVQSLGIPAAQQHIDVSQQMISLLTKCKDVVSNLTGALGYVPYHPL